MLTVTDRVSPETPYGSNALAPTTYTPSGTSSALGVGPPTDPICQSHVQVLASRSALPCALPLTDQATVSAGRVVSAEKATGLPEVTVRVCGVIVLICGAGAEPGFGTVVDCRAKRLPVPRSHVIKVTMRL